MNVIFSKATIFSSRTLCLMGLFFRNLLVHWFLYHNYKEIFLKYLLVYHVYFFFFISCLLCQYSCCVHLVDVQRFPWYIHHYRQHFFTFVIISILSTFSIFLLFTIFPCQSGCRLFSFVVVGTFHDFLFFFIGIFCNFFFNLLIFFFCIRFNNNTPILLCMN